MMADLRSEPFGKLLTDAEADIVVRNRHLGWDASTVEEARDLRNRSFQVGLEPVEPPRTHGQAVALVVLCAACTIVGGLAAVAARYAGWQ